MNAEQVLRRDEHGKFVAGSPAECGTYASYQRHRKQGETPCPQCRAANRDYQRMLRATRPHVADAERVRNAARMRALWKLAEMYPKPFKALYLAEMREKPYPPPPVLSTITDDDRCDHPEPGDSAGPLPDGVEGFALPRRFGVDPDLRVKP